MYQKLLASESLPPEAILLQASEVRPHDFTYIRDDENSPMDQNVYKVKPGNFVMVTYEIPRTGFSRAQAEFAAEALDASLMDPSITIAKLPEILEGVDLAGKSQEEVRALLLERALAGGSIEDIGIDEKYRLIEELAGQEYRQETVVGEVKEAPSRHNDGLLILSGQGSRDLAIDMANVRLLHIIGVSVPRVKGVNPANN